MKNTLNEFKKEQNKEMEILSKLRKFLDVGEGLGVDIDISLKEKLNNAIDEVKLLDFGLAKSQNLTKLTEMGHWPSGRPKR